MKGLALLANIGPPADNFPFAPNLYRPDMLELAKALLIHGANPNARLILPIVHGKSVPIDSDIGLGYNNILKVYDADRKTGRPACVGATPFLLAAMTSDAELLRLMGARGANPQLGTELNITPLMMAAGFLRVIGNRRLLEPPSNSEEEQALQSVREIVRLGANVNAVDNVGATALHDAAMAGANKIAQFLVSEGANVNAKDKDGMTPLYKAMNIQRQRSLNDVPFPARKSTADLLLKLGASPVSVSAGQS